MPIFEKKVIDLTDRPVQESGSQTDSPTQDGKSGVSVTVEWHLPFKKKKDETKDAIQNQNALKPLLTWARRQRLLCLIPVALSALAQVLLLTQVENLTNMAMAGNPNAATAAMKASLPALVLTIPLILLESLTSSRYIKNASIRLSRLAITRMAALEPHRFDAKSPSSYITGMTRFASQAVDDLFAGKLEMLSGVIELAAGVILAITVSWKLLLLSAFLFLVIFVFAQIFIGKQEKVFETHLNSEEDYTDRVREALSGYQLIRQNNLQPYILTTLDQSADTARFAKRNFHKIVYKAGQYISVIGSLGIFLFFLFLTQEASRTGASYGRVLFMLSAFLFILQPAISMVSNLPSIKNGEEALIKLMELTEPDEEADRVGINRLDRGIHFNDVSFAFGEQQVLNHVTLDIHKGEKILLIGPSGAGKTTLLKLIQKYLIPISGSITVDDIPLSDISGNQWFNCFACLTQQVFLLDDTLRNNITLRRDANPSTLDAIIGFSGLQPLVERLPDGVDTRVEFRGKNLSGGEKKRIGIARAIFRKAPLLLLDEPFSGLDEETAVDIEKRILTLTETTVINVSHVMFDKTMPLYDRILRVAEGYVEDVTPLYHGK